MNIILINLTINVFQYAAININLGQELSFLIIISDLLPIGNPFWLNMLEILTNLITKILDLPHC